MSTRRSVPVQPTGRPKEPKPDEAESIWSGPAVSFVTSPFSVAVRAAPDPEYGSPPSAFVLVFRIGVITLDSTIVGSPT